MPAPSITSNQNAYRYAAAPLPSFRATGASASIQWSAPFGSFNPSITGNNQVTFYSPANQTDPIIITAQDLGDSTVSSVQLQVWGTFIWRPDWNNVNQKLTDSMEGSFAEDGDPQFSERL